MGGVHSPEPRNRLHSLKAYLSFLKIHSSAIHPENSDKGLSMPLEMALLSAAPSVWKTGDHRDLRRRFDFIRGGLHSKEESSATGMDARFIELEGPPFDRFDASTGCSLLMRYSLASDLTMVDADTALGRST